MLKKVCRPVLMMTLLSIGQLGLNLPTCAATVPLRHLNAHHLDHLPHAASKLKKAQDLMERVTPKGG